MSAPISLVVGGIVTFNPDIARLTENIQAIISQVDSLLVYDNGSANVAEVASFVRSLQAQGQPVRLLEGGRNLGMAHALNALAGEALERGATHALLLDQDSVAGEGLVARLLATSLADPRAAVVGPLVVDRSTREPEVPRDEVLEVKRVITSGSLVSLAAWEAVGGYDRRLFVDWVDNEFCANLRAHGCRVLRDHAVSILHELGRQEYVASAPGRDAADDFRARKGYYRQNYAAWRWEDRARGQAITIRKYAGTAIARDEWLVFLRATLGRTIVLERDKLTCLKAIARGFRAGWKQGRERVPGAGESSGVWHG